MSTYETTYRGGLEEARGRSVASWVRLFRDGWLGFVVCVVAGLGVGLIATRAQPTSYGANEALVISPARGFLDPQDADKLPALTDTIARLGGTPAVLERARARYVALAGRGHAARARRAGEAASWVDSHVAITREANSSILLITTTARTQRDAVDLAAATSAALAGIIARPRGSAGSRSLTAAAPANSGGVSAASAGAAPGSTAGALPRSGAPEASNGSATPYRYGPRTGTYGSGTTSEVTPPGSATAPSQTSPAGGGDTIGPSPPSSPTVSGEAVTAAGSGLAAESGPRAGLSARAFRPNAQGRVSPTPGRNLLIGLNVGALIGVLAAFGVGSTRRRLWQAEDIAEQLDVPLLGTVRRDARQRVRATSGLAPLHTTIHRLREHTPSFTLLVTGTAAEGRLAAVSETIVRSLEADGIPLVFVDADLRRRTVSRRMAVADQPGLAEALRDPEGPHPLARSTEAGDPFADLPMIPAGRGGERETPSSDQLLAEFRAAGEDDRIVVLSAPGIRRERELAPLVRASDHVLIVADSGTPSARLLRARDYGVALQQRLLGTIVVL